MKGPRRLVVMRHAQAESFAPSDSQRALTARGQDDAAAAGRWLAAYGFTPDHALVSGAVRTQQTWATLSRAAGWELQPDVDLGLYQAGPEAALDLLRLVPEGSREVLLLGHNPTMSSLAQLLSDAAGDPDAIRLMARGHPTSALALFEIAEEWDQLSFGDGRLAVFQVSGRDSV